MNAMPQKTQPTPQPEPCRRKTATRAWHPLRQPASGLPTGLCQRKFLPEISRVFLLALCLLIPALQCEAALQEELRINAGGALCTDAKGQVWSADRFFKGGFTYATTRTISGATSQSLFQTERSGTFSYNIPVPTGRFRVTLYFAEIFFDTFGKRIFSVHAEGSEVLAPLDIAQTAGPFTALEKTFEVETWDGSLDLVFIPKLENPKLSALRIVHLREGPAPVLGVNAPPDFTADPAPSLATLAATVSGRSESDTSYASIWEQTDGPAVAEILDPSAATTNVRFQTPGVYRFRLTASCFGSTASGSTRVIVPGDTSGQAPVRIRCGGPSYTDSTGNLWVADQFFKGGATFSSTASVRGTPDPILYKNERFGTFGYQIPVRNGLYAVRIHLAEVFFNSPGIRVFNINAEGKPVASPVDIVQKTGFQNACILEGAVRVNDSTLHLDFSPLKENPKASAIEVIPVALDPPPLQLEAGPDIILQFPADTANLQARLTPAPRDPALFLCRWSQTAGPLPAAIESPNALNSSARFPVPGSYRLKVLVSSGSQSATAELGVLVLEEVLPPFGVQTSCSAPSGPVPSDALLKAAVAGIPSRQTAVWAGVWEQTAGPAPARLADPSSPVCAVRFEVPGLYIFRFSANYNGSTTSSMLSILAPGDTAGQAAIRIRAGGGAFKDSLGNQWSGDAFFKGGSFFSVTNPVKGTPDTALYQSERFGNFGYRIPVRNGLYILRLHFAELWHKNPSERIFHVNAEGTTVLSNLDLYKNAGLLNAWIWSGNIRVSDGSLDLDFLPVKENPKVAAIEVLPLALDPPPLGVDVGPERVVRLPLDTLLVQATPTGNPAQSSTASCLWSQVGGPDQAHILTPSTLVTQIHFHASGNYRFRATLSSGTTSASAELAVRVLPVPDPPGLQRIRCGGTSFIDSSNRNWAADSFFVGGSTYTSTGSVTATTDPGLYQSERSGSAFSYKIPVENGDYTVRLHFAEIYWIQPQKRIFNVFVGNRLVSNGLDLCAAAGPRSALVQEHSTTVTNGTLEVAFTALVDKAKVSAIEVLPVRNPTHLLHVVIRAPEWVVDYSNAGSVPIKLSGSQSHTHEFGQVLTRFEWREGTRILSNQADLTLQAPLGTHTYTLTIWDSENPQGTLQENVTVEVLPPSAVRGVTACYFPPGAANTPGRAPAFVEILPRFKVEATAASVGGSGLATASVILKGVWTVPKTGNYSPVFPSLPSGTLTIDGQAWNGPLSLAQGAHEVCWLLDPVSAPLLLTELTWKRDDNSEGPLLPVSHDESVMPPQINRMTATGPALGGEVVEINGVGFFPKESLAVLWGGRRLTTEILESSPERILLITPPGSGGLAVQVLTPQGTSNTMPYAYQAGTAPVVFQSKGVFSLPGPTQAAWGPDGRLYVASLTGAVTALEFDDQYNVIKNQIIPGVQNSPAYNAIGIGFNPWEPATAFNIYLGHARLFVNDGRANVRPSPYLGQVSSLSSPLFLPKPLISGLPCTNHDHGVNGIAFDNTGQLFVSIGGQTNAGIPNINLGSLDESPFSAAILSAPVQRSSFNGAISYVDAKTGLPSADQNDAASAVSTGSHDIRLYATGLRNAFGIVWRTNGRLYGTDNGPNTGFGAASLTPTTQAGDPVTPDKVLLFGKNHYYGHPNRNRGRFDPRENRYQAPWENPPADAATPPVSLLPSSRDGIDEYRATTFGGALRGHLLVQEWNGALSALALSPDGRRVESTIKQIWGTQRGLGVVCGPGGAILAVDYTGSQITVSLPEDKAATGMVAYDIFPWRAPASGDFTFVIGGKQFGTVSNTTVFIGSLQAKLSSVTPQRIKGVIPASLNPSAAFLPVLVHSNAKTSVIPEGFRYLLKSGQGSGVWREEPKPPVPPGTTTAAETGGLIYILSEDSSTFESFDPVTGLWSADFPLPPLRVKDPCLVAAGPELLVLGGNMLDSSWSVQIYTPATRKWRQGAQGPWNSVKPAVAALGRQVYVCAGEISGTASRVVAVYNVDKNLWLPLPQMPLACLEPAAAIAADSLWLFGAAAGVSTLGVQSFNLATGSWHVCPTVSQAPLPNRLGARVVCLSDEFYLIGGRLESGESLRSVDALHSSTLAWRTETPLPEPAWGLAAVTIESEIFVTGGKSAAGPHTGARTFMR
jgi:glucose/arabinose dehydrogenase